MKELKQLVQIIKESTDKTAPLLKPSKEENDLLEQRFYNGIAEGRYQTDEDAAKDLYNESPSEARYVTLKSRLKQKLLNFLFFLDFDKPGVHTSHRYEQTCLNKYHFTKMLLNKGVYGMALRIGRSCLLEAKKGDFTSIVVQTLELLQFIYVQNQQGVEFAAVQKEIEEYLLILEKERKATSLYLKLQLVLRKSNSKRYQILHDELPEAIEHLKNLWKETNSYVIFDKYYKLKIMELELSNDFQGIINLTSEVNQLHTDEKINNRRFDQRYNWFLEVSAYLRTKQYVKGLHYAERYLENFDTSTHNWFTYMENYLLLALHSKNYELAKKLMAKVEANPFKEQLTSIAKERWTLYQAYLTMFVEDIPSRNYFNYQELVYNLPTVRKDKAGYNLSLIFLQLVYYIQLKDVEALVYRVNTIEKNLEHQLKESFNDRSRTFLKLLKMVVNSNLNIELIEKKSAILSKKLLALSETNKITAEEEIIPYEHLWQFCLDSLKATKRKKSKPRLESI